MKFVTKEELAQLAVGKRYDEIEAIPFENIGQGYGFKSFEAYYAGLNYVCYIPEYCVNEETMELDLDSCYTKADFLELTGSEAKAQDLFDSVDWQHPSSLWNEWNHTYAEEDVDNEY